MIRMVGMSPNAAMARIAGLAGNAARVAFMVVS